MTEKQTIPPPKESSIPKPDVFQFVPGDKLKTDVEKFLKDNHGLEISVVEMIEIPDGKYADQVMTAFGVGNARYMQDNNTPKYKKSTKTAFGSMEKHMSPLITARLNVRSQRDKTKFTPHIIISQQNGAQPYEFRQARKYQIEEANKVLEIFEKPALDLKDPSELTKVS